MVDPGGFSDVPPACGRAAYWRVMRSSITSISSGGSVRVAEIGVRYQVRTAWDSCVAN